MNRVIGIGLVIAFVALTSSCSSRSRVEENWGQSFRAKIDLQTANPDRPNPDAPLETLDPETGLRVADRYYEGQDKQQQRVAPSVIIQGD